jgi:CheY-like chemotaxis protein/predicted kinase
MPSTLIVLSGPPLPGRWALARALARRLGARRFPADESLAATAERALAEGALVLIEGDLATRPERARWCSLPATERLLVEWDCPPEQASREVFRRYASRPRALAEAEMARYLADRALREPIAERPSGAQIVKVNAEAPLADQLLRVLAALAPRPTVSAPVEPRLGVLVVEDDFEQRELLAEVLAELGCSVELAPNAGVALALLEDGAHGIDVVVSDQRMPGMSGVELARTVAARYPHVRPVLLTAFSDEAIGADVVTVLAKPLRVVDLQRALEEARPTEGR